MPKSLRTKERKTAQPPVVERIEHTDDLSTAVDRIEKLAASSRAMALANPAFAANIGKGRAPGSVNKTTQRVKEVIERCFENIGGEKAFATWARTHPDEFYKMYARLLPVEAKAGIKRAVLININSKETKL